MQISVSSQTTLLNTSNFFVFALYDASAPSTLLESQQPVKPYGNPLQISFLYNCIKGHIYVIKLWESADSTPTGIVRNSFSQAVNGSNIYVRLPEYYTVGIDAGWVAGATSVVNLTWEGWEYWVVRNPNIMIPDSTSNPTPNYHQVATGGFNLIQAGDTLQDQENFEVFFVPQIIQDNSGTAIFSTGRIVTASTTLTTGDIGNAILVQSVLNIITVTLPVLESVSDFGFFYIYSCGGNQINCSVVANGTDKFNWPGINKSQIILGQVEVLKIFKAFGVWNVENDLTGYKSVGESFFDYKIPINSIQAAGQLLVRLQYPRLWEYVQSLGAGVVVSDTSWTSTFETLDGIVYYTNQGFFSTGDGSTTFRLPLKSFMTPKGIDNITRLPGSFEPEQGLVHQHETSTGTLPASLFGEGQTRLIGGYKDQFNAKDDLVSQPTGATGTYLARWGNRNLVNNVGELALIRI